MSNRPKRRCLALTKAGDQCAGHASNTTDYCGAHGPKAGRHTKLTDTLTQALTDQARKGLYRNELAQLAGVDTRTLYRWLEAGAADEEAGNNTVYTRLRHALARAEAEAEESMLDAVRSQARGPAADWRAAAWYLERRYPDKYGNRSRVTVDDQAGGKVETVTVEGEARRRELLGLLERAGALTQDEDPTA